MHAAKQTLLLLRRRPVLWVPQVAAACINLLLNTGTMAAARRLSQRLAFSPGSLLAYGPELRTPDLLIASETIKLPVILPSKAVQYILVVAADAVT